MKKCSKCGHFYPSNYKKCPYCKMKKQQEADKKKEEKLKRKSVRVDKPQFKDIPKRYLEQPNIKTAKNSSKKMHVGIFAIIVVWICVIAMIFTAVLGNIHKSPFTIDVVSNQDNNNSVEFNEGINVLNSEKLENGVDDLKYSEEKNEYTLTYENLPDEFKKLNKGEIFVVPANEKAKNYSFKIGFSGKLSSRNENSVSFSLPQFNEVFSKLKIENKTANVENVAFVADNGVSAESFVPNYVNTASLGANSIKTDKVTFGDYSAEMSYKKTNKTSKLKDYELLAKKLKLKIDKTSKTSENENIDISGSVTLDNPAIKFNMDYDGENDDLKSYDVGFITDQSVNLNIKGTTNVGLPRSKLDVGKYGIIDLKDTSDLEPGKVSLGTFFVGVYCPVLYNLRNLTPVIGVCLVFQVCLTANGKIEIECNASESSYLHIEANSNGDNIYEMKNSDFPNPVIDDETDLDESKDYDSIKMSSSAKGTLDLTSAISVDVGFSILGTIPIKLANDILNFELITEFSEDESTNANVDIVEDLHPKDIKNISFYQFKTQSKLLVDVGASFKIAGVECKIGELGYKKTLKSKVWYQYPKAVDFSLSECDFGGIQLGDSYTKKQINKIFYKKKSETGSYLKGKIKDKFLQSTTDGIMDKLNYDTKNLFEELPLSGNYDLTCFSDGAIYFSDNGCVKAELITGDEVYNKSYISKASNEKHIRKVYSEPDKQETVMINIGEIGSMLLKQIGMEELEKYDGTNITVYHYEADKSNMDIYFDGGGEMIFLLVY